MWPTPSKLALADACVYPWHRLAPAWPEEVRSDDASFGSAFHDAMHVAAVFGISPAVLEEVADKYDLAPAERTKLLGAVEAAVEEAFEQREVSFRAGEVSFLYNVAQDTAQVLPEALDNPPPGFVHGTVDLVELVDGEVFISDWKTGGRSGELDVRSDRQLGTYALMAARAFGRRRVGVIILHAGEDGVRPEQHVLDAFDLATVRGRLIETLAKVDAGGPPRPGRHCATKYCPIVSQCPATLKALAEVQATTDAQLPMKLVIDSPEVAARVRVGLVTIEKALEQYKTELRRYIDQHGAFEIAPGVLYGKVEREGDQRVVAEHPGAQAAIRELLGEAADLALEVSTSFTAIERAARAAAKARGLTGKGSLKQMQEPVLARLRAIGAIKQGARQTRYVEINVAKKAKGEAA